MTGYYDYVLGLIPAALLGVTAFLSLVGLSWTAAVPAGALVAAGLIAHAMFVRGPVVDEGGLDRGVDRAASSSPVSASSSSAAASSD
ncbi:hypothetical protein GJ633_12845 [Halorubrum sp. CBA1125]|uniref:hypothetical protein n=1 Tax=Halorubrum sp. CBA1125 TaxID=2668072 RepID=UPI0012E9547D|nr:hypothetical protein [Halorubrum sp. CBA1125]MUW15425.1 hypothetical protein [Halorubrum sp. CBA1125]